MKKKMFVAMLGIALLAEAQSIPGLPFFGPPIVPPLGIPQPTYDVGQNPTAFKALIQLMAQARQDLITYQSIRNQELWFAQVFKSKAAFRTLLLPALYSAATNVYGEMSRWNPAMSTGVGALPAWMAATATLNPTAPLLAGVPLGDDRMAELASIEALSATGVNNISTIGQARSYLDINAPAMLALQNTILDPAIANNSPTQQMALVANAEATNMNLHSQNLQVQTGILETMNAIGKSIRDLHTSNLNIQVDEAVTRGTQAVIPGGYAAAFMGHP